MPFCRIVRDNRGYEYLSLVQQTSGRRGKTRQQILYWYRSPPNIKVGRQALDEEVMRELEARNPGVQFDWNALRDTPPLLPAVEPWRERRRAERAARQIRDADEGTSAAAPEPAASHAIDRPEPLEEESPVESPHADTGTVPVDGDRLANGSEPMPAAVPGSIRRRRHRGRGRRPAGDGLREPSSSAVPTEDASTSSTSDEDETPPDHNE
jgi:hypothetical protein